MGGYLLQRFAPDPNALLRIFGLYAGGCDARPSLAVVDGDNRAWRMDDAGLNVSGVLAFGTPVSRRFGPGGAGRFFAFYFLCGLIASLGYVGLHWGQAVVLVGASGAISGLIGAALRLIDRTDALAAFTSPTVLAMAGAWLFINLLMAARWIDVGAGGAPVAWEAHLAPAYPACNIGGVAGGSPDQEAPQRRRSREMNRADH